ncbi:hypothetical protein SAMN05428949_4870 [Chitinophaga sp. YR627]|uniref:hypothetical protein n=1 Tax=Chitinophaga sp. YR627 TaxID=1881041 RepID=UPI0008E86567|nr:hypothetical protein [Chitinophaga sp. YR627]SFO30538.1 hypothetical protein SAMN05428949_4870 [Chitinophaga sp. YR627]
MISRDNDIANELREIIPDAEWPGIKPFPGKVPTGYFDQLPGQILQKVYATEVKEELETLSPLLSAMPKSVPLSVPQDYFNQLSQNILLNISENITGISDSVMASDDEPSILADLPKAFPMTAPAGYFDQLPAQLLQQIHASEAREELAALSTLLVGIPKNMPLSVPEGYFAQLSTEVMAAVAASATKPATVISEQPSAPAPATVIRKMHTRRYIKWAVAASLIALVSVSTLLFVRENNHSANIIDNALANVSDQEIMEYLQAHTDAFDKEELATYAPAAEESYEIPEVDELPAEAIEHYLDNTGLLKESLTDN